MSEMTVSQGLRQLARLKGRMADYKTRAFGAVSYQQEAKPAFELNATLEKMALTRREIISIESAVAVANATSTLDFEGAKLTVFQAIKTLQELKDEIAWLKTLPCRAQTESHEEDVKYVAGGGHQTVRVPWRCDLPEAKRADLVEAAQTRFFVLNDLVEKANHATLIKVA